MISVLTNKRHQNNLSLIALSSLFIHLYLFTIQLRPESPVNYWQPWEMGGGSIQTLGNVRKIFEISGEKLGRKEGVFIRGG